jgi:hypothetical protein
MIEKINSLKSNSKDSIVKSLCEDALSSLSSPTYLNIPENARVEVERATMENLFEELSGVKDKNTQKWLKNAKRSWAIKNLGIREAVNSLSVGETAENITLQQVVEHYKKLLEVQPEVLLYESFISGLQSFLYFPKVGNAIEAIEDRVKNYNADVSISKIMETMKKSKSNYLIPLIEDLVQNYLDDKNMQTKSSLKEGLIKFSYDPFIRDLINLVSADATDLQLEYANAQCDIEKVYSPVLYLGENEAVFGVRGSFYIKKGNTLSRLTKDSISRLDPEFVSLCEAINSSDVIIDGKSITIYEGSNKAVIKNDGISVNGKEFTNEDFKNSAEIAEWTGKGKFLSLVEKFRSNFDEIAEVDFAKRVFLKENTEYAADVFKLRGNISIATYNPSMDKGTFYRNVNPIQAKGLMMEHLRFDVSKAFSELLPDEDKINEEIDSTKKEYNGYISDLEKKISEFKLNPFSKDINEQVIQALEEELVEVKNEYKDYLNEVESFMRPPAASINEAKISLNVEGPLEIEVDGQKYSVPIPNEGEGSGQEGDEFGTEVGDENIESEPASAVTFDDTETELLGDSPSIQADEVNLGADEIEADADAAEAEAELAGGEEGEEIPGEGGEELPGEGEGEEGEIKIGDEEDLDLGLGDETEDGEGEGDEEGESEEEEEVEKVEDSAGDAKPGKELKRKVYLKKKKS